MPGRAPRTNEVRLCPKQHTLARRVLQPAFDPQGEISQWSAPEKMRLVGTINAEFVRSGFSPVYSVRKLEDWISNAKYRATCKQRKMHPSCWTLESRSKARAKARDAKRKQRRHQSANQTRGLSSARGVEKLRQVHYTHINGTNSVAADVSWSEHAPIDDALTAAKSRPEAFASIRQRFEQDGFGRTDPLACHRGPLQATGINVDTGEALPAAADHQLFRHRQSSNGENVMPTFLAFGAALQPTHRSTADVGQSSNACCDQPGLKLEESGSAVIGSPLSESDHAMSMDSPHDFLRSGWQPSLDISALEAAMSPGPSRSQPSGYMASHHGDYAVRDTAVDDGNRCVSRSMSCSSSDQSSDENSLESWSSQSDVDASGICGLTNELPAPGLDWELYLERNLDILPTFEQPSISTSNGNCTWNFSHQQVEPHCCGYNNLKTACCV